MTDATAPAEEPARALPAVIAQEPLGNPWRGTDPFLFCAHHDDRYPAGNGRLGIDAPARQGREPGSDFSRREGWSLYHGEEVPGFPGHPHRGFETITVVPKGLVDHADSLGAAARYGEGDVQWLTAGRGVQHSEMFPLTHDDAPNPLDLFQIWLNLPAASKMAPPAFTMFWADQVPRVRQVDAQGRTSLVEVVAGNYHPVDIAAAAGQPLYRAPTPPTDSWAAQARADVAVWLIRLDPGAELTLPAARGAGTRRTLYCHAGETVEVDGQRIDGRQRVEVRAGIDLPLRNVGEDPVAILMLQGRPIGEPVAARGPFVMNTEAELRQAVTDFMATRFGGWPWPDEAPTHGDAGRFARHPDGRIERP